MASIVFPSSTIPIPIQLLLLLVLLLLDSTILVKAVDLQLINRLCQATVSPPTCMTCIKSHIPPASSLSSSQGGFFSDSNLTDQQIIGGMITECGSQDVVAMAFAMEKQQKDIAEQCEPGFLMAIKTSHDIANGEIQRGLYREASNRINGQIRPWVNACGANLRAKKLGVPSFVSSLTPVADMKYRIASQVLNML